MDPAGTGNFAQDRHDVQESYGQAACNLDPEARVIGREYLSLELGLDCGLQPSESDLREDKVAEVAKRSKDQYGWRKVVRNFTPSYANIHFTAYLKYPFMVAHYGSGHP